MHGAGVGHALQIGQTARLNCRTDHARGGTVDDDQENFHDQVLSATCMPQLTSQRRVRRTSGSNAGVFRVDSTACRQGFSPQMNT